MILNSEGMPPELPLLLDDADIQAIQDNPVGQLERAGVDADTQVDTFLAMQGRDKFVTDLSQPTEDTFDAKAPARFMAESR